jgi:hypothetical protein
MDGPVEFLVPKFDWDNLKTVPLTASILKHILSSISISINTILIILGLEQMNLTKKWYWNFDCQNIYSLSRKTRLSRLNKTIQQRDNAFNDNSDFSVLQQNKNMAPTKQIVTYLLSVLIKKYFPMLKNRRSSLFTIVSE